MRQCRVLVDPVTAVGTTLTQVSGYVCSKVSFRFKLTLSIIKYDVMSLMIVNIYRKTEQKYIEIDLKFLH